VCVPFCRDGRLDDILQYLQSVAEVKMLSTSDHNPSAMNPDAVRCAAKSKRTGKRCKNPAVRGKRVCRLHGGLSLSGAERTEKQKANRPPAAGKVNRGSFATGNQTARKHGAYTSRLSPEEQEDFERLRADFTEEASRRSPVTAFDSLLIDMAALACVKVDAAAVQDAPVRVVVLWNRLLLSCLRELRATRATRDRSSEMGHTPAEVMSELLKQISSRAV
jgi:hypothetical protein